MQNGARTGPRCTRCGPSLPLLRVSRMPRVRARSPALLSILILFSGTECVRGVSLIRRLPTLSVWSLGGAVLRHTFLVRPVEFSPVGRELSTGLVFAISWGSFLARSRFYESIHRRGGRYECFFLRGRRRDDGNPGVPPPSCPVPQCTGADVSSDYWRNFVRTQR